jgi:signal transduction histidine kinase
MRDITARKQTEEKIFEYQNKLRSLASQLTLAEERERRRIATELHDRVGQSLAICKIKLGQLQSGAQAPEDILQSIQETRALLDQAIQDTRSLIFRISSPILYELGFEAAVEWLTEDIQKRHAIPVAFEDDGLPKPLDDDVRVLLFQATSELLINVVKHARAGSVRVSIEKEGESIRIGVEDDGRGFNLSDPSHLSVKAGGFGLFSIRERLNDVHGCMEVHSPPGAGSRVTMVAPLRRPQ